MSAKFPDLSGQQFGGYMLERKLGEGGMASVYLSYQIAVKRQVAIKVLPPQLALQPGYLERFEREVELAARLEHPHILPIYDYGSQEGYSYIVMRLVDGGSLQDQVERFQETSLTTLLKILDQIASALDYAHTNSIIHRDLKASNILFDKHGNAYLADFGIAKAVQESAMASLTGTDQIVGTPSYMSPEQWRGEPLDGRADVYSFGVMVYQLLAGEFPFSAPTPFAMMHKHLSEMPPQITHKRHDLPPHLNSVFERVLAKERENRYGTAGQFVAALQQNEMPVEATFVLANDQTATAIGKSSYIASSYQPDQPTITPPPTTLIINLPSRNLLFLWVIVFIGLVLGGIFLFSRANSENTSAVVTPTLDLAPTTTQPATLESTQTTSPVTTQVSEISASQTVERINACGFGSVPRLCINAGTLQTRIEVQDMPAGRINSTPAWSPNGEQIVFSFIPEGGSEDSGHQLYIVNRDGTDLKALPFGGNDIEPSWSPDGRWIAHHSSCDVRLISPDGTDSQTIFDGDPSACSMNMRWSPNSQYLAFIATPLEQNEYSVYVADFAGGWVKQIYRVNSALPSVRITWSPQGELLHYARSQWRVIDPVCWQEEDSICDIETNTIPYEKRVPTTWSVDSFPFWGGEVELPDPVTVTPESNTGPSFFVDTFENGLDSALYQTTRDWTANDGVLVSPVYQHNPNEEFLTANVMPNAVLNLEWYNSVSYFRFTELSPDPSAPTMWIFLKTDDCGANFTFHLHQGRIFLTQLPCHTDESLRDDELWFQLDDREWTWETNKWYEMRLTVEENVLRLRIDGEAVLEHVGKFPFPHPDGPVLDWAINENTQIEIDEWMIAEPDSLGDVVHSTVMNVDSGMAFLAETPIKAQDFISSNQAQPTYLIMNGELHKAIWVERDLRQTIPDGEIWLTENRGGLAIGINGSTQTKLPSEGSKITIILPYQEGDN